MKNYKVAILVGWIILIFNTILDYVINIDVRINIPIYLVCIGLFLYGIFKGE